MIPVERVTELLAVHQFDGRSDYQDCQCGWVWERERDDTAHLAHQARVLADAGLIPTQREWGVTVLSGGIEAADSARTAHQIKEIFGSEVHTRWTTEWETA